MVPTGFTSPPTEQMPAIRADSSISEEMRVSLPMVTRGFSPGCLPLASTSAAARPTL